MASPLRTSNADGTASLANGGALVVPSYISDLVIDSIESSPGVPSLADVQASSSKSEIFPVVSGAVTGYIVNETAEIGETSKSTSTIELNAIKMAAISRQTREFLSSDVPNSSNVLTQLASDVRDEFQNMIDYQILGVKDGSTEVTSSFNHNFREDVTDTTAIASLTGSNIQDGISAAVEACESAGANPSRLGVLLANDTRRVIRDEVAASDSNVKLFNSIDQAVWGLPYSHSKNVNAAASGLVAIVGPFSDLCKIRVRQDIEVAASDSAVVNGESLFQRDEVALRWVMRVGGGILLADSGKFCKVVLD